MNGAKAGLLVAWLLCGAGFVISPDSTLASWARAGFGLMLAAHVIEFLLFVPRFQKAQGSLAAHFLNTVVFGLLHIRELPAAESDSAG